MNPVKLIIAAVAVLLVGVALGYWVASERTPSAGSAIGADDDAQNARRVLYWHDPMVPGARFDKPGKSPYMDMPLVPVYADEEGGAAVSVDPTVAQNLGIRVDVVRRQVLPVRLSAVGAVAFDERLIELVQARVEGYVARLHVKAPLERVKRGQPLAEIVAPQWLEAQQEYLQLLDAKSGRAAAIRDAARQRLVVLGVPESTIRTLETERKTASSTTLLAPRDGVVSELGVREGSAFTPGAALFRINGMRTVWVNAQVPEAQLSVVAVGAGVEARAVAWPETFRGRVIAVLPEVDAQTRTAPVRIEIDNPDLKLSPGMYVSLVFSGEEGDEQLVVPSEAIIMTGERSVVIVARDGGGYDVAEVTVGPEVEGKTTVLRGLEEGQRVVVSGQFLIDSEASLRSAVTRLSTGAPDSAPTAPADHQDHQDRQ